MGSAFLLGLASTALTAAIGVAVAEKTGFLVYSVGLMFVIPLGGLAGGMLSGLGLAGGLYRAHVYPEKRHWLQGAALGALGFLAFQYGLYAADENAASMGFWTYLAASTERAGRSFFVDGRFIEAPPIPGRTSLAWGGLALYNRGRLLLDALGFVAGGLFIVPAVWTDELPCPSCRGGMLRRRLLFFAPPQEARALSLELKKIPDAAALLSWIDAKRSAVKFPPGPHVRAEFEDCGGPECMAARVLFKAMVPGTDRGIVESPRDRVEVALRRELAAALKRPPFSP